MWPWKTSPVRPGNGSRADLGAIQNRLEQTINRLGIMAENLQSAESRVRDADMAQEMIKFTKSQILQQSGTAMLAARDAVAGPMRYAR